MTRIATRYYDILEVPRKAKKEEIKEAYRRLAKRYHPDRNVDDPEAETRFKEIQEAHATLSDSWKKALYDQDLQFSKFGTGVTQEVERERWTEHWEKETPEEREARKERYKRYAAGERNDLPPDKMYSSWWPATVVFVVGGVFYVCVKAPEWQEGQPHFCDPMYDDKSVPLVRAFHDPVRNRWERLPEGQDPPTPRQLYSYYQKKKPELLEEVDIRILPKVSLTVLNVPKTSAAKPSFPISANAG
ncbi:dnaJ [Symbiodinium pilosum]|uniref:DnaJ protein n=1 Tax=Symbiodinium pilosum TaxID=2952 RepID=A0A812TPE7_SYMPI|nr:dnaJ [Symbiodinium pilosum]